MLSFARLSTHHPNIAFRPKERGRCPLPPLRSLQDPQVSRKIFGPGLHQTRVSRMSARILLGRLATPGLLSLFLELCYGKFTKDFTSALKKLSESYDKQGTHISKDL